MRRNFLTNHSAPGRLAWGNDNFSIDPDYGIRSFFPAVNLPQQTAPIPWLPAAVAKLAGAPGDNAVRPDVNESRCFNYYGPPGWIPSISYFLAINPNGAPRGFFKDKIVFIGEKKSAGFSGAGQGRISDPLFLLGAAGKQLRSRSGNPRDRDAEFDFKATG